MVDVLLASLAPLVGAALMLLLAIAPALVRHQPRWNTERTRHYGWILVVFVSLILIVLQDRTLTAPRPVFPWPSVIAMIPPLTIQPSQAGSALSLGFAAIMLSIFLTSQSRRSHEDQSSEGRGKWALSSLDKSRASLIVIIVAGLITLLPASPSGMMLSWVLLDAIIGLGWLYESGSGRDIQYRRRILGWGTGAVATLLLWGATIPMQMGTSVQRISSLTLSGWSGIALTLAVLLRLSPFPFHILGSRSLASHETSGREQRWVLELALQTAPIVAGVGLLAQLSGTDALPSPLGPLVSALLLTGLVACGILAWLSEKDDQTVGWILTTQAGFVVLAGLSAGPEAALAEGMVLILAGAILQSNASRAGATVEVRIAGAIGIAAMAGLPLTWGGNGRLALYQVWLDSGRGLYILLAAGASLLTISAAARMMLRPATHTPTVEERVANGIAMAILALILVKPGISPLTEVDLPVWLAIMIALCGGALLAWGAPSLAPIHAQTPSWLPPFLSLVWLTSLADRLGGAAAGALQSVQQVLEGEGALLWLLIGLALGWMLLTAQPPG